MMKVVAGCAALAVLLASAAEAKYSNGPTIPPATMAKLKKYDSRYYIFFSDLEPEKVEAAIARMTAVAEEYYQRTKGFGGAITKKFPFFLIADDATYKAVGGESAGCTWADRLCAHMTPAFAGEFWHVIQHEAFHQFSHNVISENLPGWIDEGMAEYFGESLWTGDGLESGIFPANRYTRFIPRVKDAKLTPFKDFIMLKSTDFRGVDMYDQAMSMIHFFVHANNGKYQKQLSSYIKMTADGAPGDAAFAKAFGGNIAAIEKEYLAWWSASPATMCDHAYAEATVRTLTSFLGRAHTQGQKFADAAEFLKACHDGSLKKNAKQLLPDDLLADTLKRADALKEWSLDTPDKGLPKLILTEPDGTVFTASFTTKDGKVDKVSVKVVVKEAGK
jgi:hypothetical protein